MLGPLLLVSLYSSFRAFGAFAALVPPPMSRAALPVKHPLYARHHSSACGPLLDMLLLLLLLLLWPPPLPTRSFCCIECFILVLLASVRCVLLGPVVRQTCRIRRPCRRDARRRHLHDSAKVCLFKALRSTQYAVGTRHVGRTPYVRTMSTCSSPSQLRPV